MYTPSVRWARTTLKRRALKEGQTDGSASKAVRSQRSWEANTKLSLCFQKCHLVVSAFAILCSGKKKGRKESQKKRYKYYKVERGHLMTQVPRLDSAALSNVAFNGWGLALSCCFLFFSKVMILDEFNFPPLYRKWIWLRRRKKHSSCIIYSLLKFKSCGGVNWCFELDCCNKDVGFKKGEGGGESHFEILI